MSEKKSKEVLDLEAQAEQAQKDKEVQEKADAQAQEQEKVKSVNPDMGSADFEPLDEKSLKIQQEAQAASFDADKEALQVKDLPASGPIVKDQHEKLAEAAVEDVAAGDVDAEVAALEVQKRVAGVGTNLYADLDAKILALKAKK